MGVAAGWTPSRDFPVPMSVPVGPLPDLRGVREEWSVVPGGRGHDANP
jgi:hypothetical protein